MEGLKKIEAELQLLLIQIEELQKQALALVPLAAQEIRAKYETLFVLYAKQSKSVEILACCVSKETAEHVVQSMSLSKSVEIVQKATKDMRDEELIHIRE